MIATILKVQDYFGRHQVIYRFDDPVIKVAGPCIEIRPADEDHQVWLDSRIQSVIDQYTAPQPPADIFLINEVVTYDDSVLKSALGMTDKQIKDCRDKKNGNNGNGQANVKLN